VVSSRLKKDALRAILAATNTKQRTRMMYLYYFAERENFMVCGTTNRTEFALGYFVKYGDGGVDIEPIAHLYKAQVYQLADELVSSRRSRAGSPARIPSAKKSATRNSISGFPMKPWISFSMPGRTRLPRGNRSGFELDGGSGEAGFPGFRRQNTDLRPPEKDAAPPEAAPPLIR